MSKRPTSRAMFILGWVVLLLPVLLAPAWAISFDTTSIWNGSDEIASYGAPKTSTYGETFMAPSDPVLTDFTFYIRPDPGVTLSSRAYVFGWAGSLLGGEGGGATGPALFTSPTSMVISGDGTTFVPLTVHTGGLNLTPGNPYVMCLTVSNPSDYVATTGTSSWGVLLYDHVPNDGGGGFVFYNNGSDPGLLNTHTWDNLSDYGDLAFKANFAPVPEPSTLLLLGSGLIGLRVMSRKRTQRPS